MAAVLYAIGTMLTWAGYLLAARALFLLAMRTPRPLLLAVSGSCLVAGSLITGSGFRVPVLWPIMPFAAWAAIWCLAMTVVRLLALFAGQPTRLSAARWGVAAAAFLVWLALVPDRQITIATGAVTFSPGTFVAFIVLAAAAVLTLAAVSRRPKRSRLAKAFGAHVALVAGCVIFALPLLWLLLTSLKADTSLSPGLGLLWIPDIPVTEMHKGERLPVITFNGERGLQLDRTPDGHARILLEDGRAMIVPQGQVKAVERSGVKTANYSEALGYLPAEARRGLTYLENTFVVAALCVLGGVLSSAAVAYAFARMRFPGRDALFGLLLATMMLPAAIPKLPQFMIFSRLGWVDTLYPLWVPSFFGSAVAIFMLRQFFRRVPQDLDDAAKIDGASYLRSFWSVMLPQVRPGLAVVGIMAFIAAWNSFLDPLIYATTPQHVTVSYALQLYAADRLSQPNLLAAFTVMALLPVVLVFWIGQRFLDDGR